VTDPERALLLIVARYVEGQIWAAVGRRVAGAREAGEAITDAVRAVVEQFDEPEGQDDNG